MAPSPRRIAAATAQALVWLALALPAHVLVKALSPAFFAREDTLTPLLATLKGVVLALVPGCRVRPYLVGAGGIAASIALGAWSTALTLIRHGAETFGFSIDAAARRRLPAHSSRPRWRWARCCGWRRGSCRR